MTIRILTPKDAPAYRQLRLKSYQESPFAFSESYEDEVQKSEADFATELQIVGTPPEWFVLGAFSEENLIGFVKFRRDLRFKARHKSMIHAMYIDLNFRKQGIAKKLIDEILNRAAALEGLEQIHLWVLHGEDSAADFYRKCGFESQGTRVKNDLKIGGAYVDAEYMVLYL